MDGTQQFPSDELRQASAISCASRMRQRASSLRRCRSAGSDDCQRNGYSVEKVYIEPRASGTDDRRPGFQQMIADACSKPAPYEAIIVHSLSRFFRDLLEFALYEQKLNKAGVKVVSITQQTSDDPAGEMARRIFSMFDEYQSKENAKHTLRAMKENARQGYCNGSRPPFGYKLGELDLVAARGKKKRLIIDETEAHIVRRMFDLYLHGLNGEEVGCKQIAAHFNERGLTLRGSPWTRTRVHNMLSDTAYMGKYVFNRKNVRTRTVKPESEWVRVAIDPIVSAETFGAVATKRHQRSPAVTPARVVNSPTLLTGLLHYDNCGAGMTLATVQERKVPLLQMQHADRQEHWRVHDPGHTGSQARPSSAGCACG